MARIDFSDPEQFEKAFREHFPEMCKVAYPILTDSALAKDTAQEVFLDLWRNRGSLEIKSSLRAYLYRSTVNKSLDKLRSRNRRGDLHENAQKEMPAALNTTGEAILAGELAELVQRGIAKMPPQCALIFNMSRFRGLKNKEIAEELGISVKTVENQMGKALRILREFLKPYLKDMGAGALILLWHLWGGF